jgi:hypothetical protein
MVRFYTYVEPFLANPRRQVSLSEFETHFKVPHQTIKPQLEKLVKERVIVCEKRGRFLFYELNLNNPLLRDYLVICEKERLFTFLEKNPLMRELHKRIRMENALVFGSSVNSKSFNDIDILIIGKGFELKPFEQTYSVKTHIVATEDENLTEILLKEIKKKHIILTNHEYFVGVLYRDELVQKKGDEAD